MSIAGRIKNKFRQKYYEITSKKSKMLFDANKKSVYQYFDEAFCHDQGVFEALVKKYHREMSEYWNSQSSFNIKRYFPKTYDEAQKLIFDNFFPLLPENPCLLDIGCASGEWTILAASKCKEIVGYEFSQKMVDTAIAEAEKQGVKNVRFYQSDARSLPLGREYDGAMILAVLMYFRDENEIEDILKNVFNHLKPGAFLCTRDTLNDEKRELMYLYNVKTGYSGFYWSKDKYYELFRRAGFVMEKELLLDEVTSRNLRFIHVGNIWKKPMTD